MDEKSHGKILISCETLIGANLLRIRFDEIDGFIKICEGTRYLQ